MDRYPPPPQRKNRTMYGRLLTLLCLWQVYNAHTNENLTAFVECTKRGINMRTHAPRPRREAALDLNFEGLADSGDSGGDDGEAGPAPKRVRGGEESAEGEESEAGPAPKPKRAHKANRAQGRTAKRARASKEPPPRKPKKVKPALRRSKKGGGHCGGGGGGRGGAGGG